MVLWALGYERAILQKDLIKTTLKHLFQERHGGGLLVLSRFNVKHQLKHFLKCQRNTLYLHWILSHKANASISQAHTITVGRYKLAGSCDRVAMVTASTCYCLCLSLSPHEPKVPSTVAAATYCSCIPNPVTSFADPQSHFISSRRTRVSVCNLQHSTRLTAAGIGGDRMQMRGRTRPYPQTQQAVSADL